MNTLQMIKMMPTLDGRDYVEWTKSFNTILQITWRFLSKIAPGLERPEPIPRENREGEESTSDFDDSDSNPSEVSAYGSSNSNEDSNNSDDIEAWNTANEHSFGVLRLTTTGTARIVLLKFEPRNGRLENGRETCFFLLFFSSFILDIKFVGLTSRGHIGGRSQRISHPPSFCGARLNFSREKDSAIPFPRRL